jgi:hypothetical protein
MKTVTLSAHFDGKHIQLDEPFKLPPDARLLVTAVPEELEYALTEYGVTSEQIDACVERVNKDIKDLRKAGKLKPWK